LSHERPLASLDVHRIATRTFVRTIPRFAEWAVDFARSTTGLAARADPAYARFQPAVQPRWPPRVITGAHVLPAPSIRIGPRTNTRWFAAMAMSASPAGDERSGARVRSTPENAGIRIVVVRTRGRSASER
jgi:hypothetical protein